LIGQLDLLAADFGGGSTVLCAAAKDAPAVTAKIVKRDNCFTKALVVILMVPSLALGVLHIQF